MSLLNTQKTGSDIISLDSGRRISTGRLWALRAFVIVIVLFGLASGATSGPSEAVGSLIGAWILYWLALKWMSSDQ